MILTLAKGYIIGAGMIIPLGAQNAYVLSRAINKNYHLTAATICILCDFILMSLGVFGGGTLVASNDALLKIITWAGVIFLTIYAGIFFKDFLFGQPAQQEKGFQLSTKKMVVFTTLAVTFLNPHVYLDTVVIIGSISGQYAVQDKGYFLLGTMLASLTWFYTLSLGAAKLSYWLSQDHVQRGINLLVALIMWFIAGTLILSVI